MIRRALAVLLIWMGLRDTLETAIARVARARGAVEACAAAVHYYQMLVLDCDPEVNWWQFANLRQRLEDAREEHLDAYKRCVEAESRLKALIADGVVHA